MTSPGLIDLHCHVLPGIDDGPPDLEGSLNLARAAVANGITTIVATPHVNHSYPDNTATRIMSGVVELRRALSEAGIPLGLRTGGEISLTRAPELPDSELRLLRLGGSSHLLIECPNTPSAAGFEAALDSIAARGHKLLLAHVERIPAFRDDIELVHRLVQRGMLVQITAGSFSGRFGKASQDSAEELLRAGLVHDVASDAHHAERRSPSITAHLAEAGYEELTDHVARAVPEAILAETRLPVMPTLPPAPRKGLGRLLRRAS